MALTLHLSQVGDQQVHSLPRGVAVRYRQRPFQQQQLPVHPAIDPHQPIRVQRPQQAPQLLPVWERISECISYLIWYVAVLRSLWQTPRLTGWRFESVCVFLFLSQARFSDAEEDISSRTPVSRQLSCDVKQVRHTSQRSKVRGHNMGEFDRTAAHNPTDPAICLLSQITVSISVCFTSTHSHLLTLMCTICIKKTLCGSRTFLSLLRQASERHGGLSLTFPTLTFTMYPDASVLAWRQVWS